MKRFTALVLAMCMVFSLCTMETHAHTDSEQSTADALNSLNLFQGVSTTETDYALDKELNRYEGYTLLIRMLGVEKEAAEGYQSGKYKYTFTDTIANWAKPYVAYAQSTGLTKGVDTAGKNFGGKSTLSEKMFLTMSLRALGYSDSGDNPDFQWSTVTDVAEKVGLVSETPVGSLGTEKGELSIDYSSAEGTTVSLNAFTRGNTVSLFWTVLNTPLKNETTTLSEKLISEGVFTAEAFAVAKIIEDTATQAQTKPVYADEDSHTHEIISKIIKEPACTTQGVRMYYCKNCNETIRTEMIPAIGHGAEDYKSDSTGHWKVCRVCGEKTTAAEKHQFNKNGICTVCGYKCTHDYQSVVTKPTCSADGYTTHTCSICGDSYRDTPTARKAHEHVGTVTKKAACTSEGVMTYTCSGCGDSYQKAIPATGHIAGQCIGDDTGHWTICSVCGERISKVEAHSYANGDCSVCHYKCNHNYKSVVTKPTCTTEGYTTYTCSVCGKSYIGNKVDMIAHKYVGTITEKATCTSDGVMTYTCSECGDSKTETIPATGHGAEDYKSDSTGHWKVCRVCGEKTTVAEKHQFNKNGICTVCGYKCTHDYQSVVTKPTCSADGYTTHTCSICGCSYRDTPTARKAHEYVGTMTKQPTCTETGEISYSCKHCGDHSIASTILPKTEHNYVQVERKEATSSTNGYVKYKCTMCPATYQTTLFWNNKAEDYSLPEDSF